MNPVSCLGVRIFIRMQVFWENKISPGSKNTCVSKDNLCYKSLLSALICHLFNSHLLSSLLYTDKPQISAGIQFRYNRELCRNCSCWRNKASSTIVLLTLLFWLLGTTARPVQPFLWSEPRSSYVRIPVVPHTFYCQVSSLHGVPHHWPTAVWGTVASFHTCSKLAKST